MNKEFQENAIQVADILDLDELASAQLLLESEEDAEILARSNVTFAVIHFHERRQFLLECMRLLLKISIDNDRQEDLGDVPGQLVSSILESKDGSRPDESLYVKRCMRSMADIEMWLQALGERQQGTLVLGQVVPQELNEITAFQLQSLEQQHESLGAITHHLIKANKADVEHFRTLLDHMPRLDRMNNLVLHYIPIIIGFTGWCGRTDGNVDIAEARSLNMKIMNQKDSSPWPLREFQAATITWWLAEYSARYTEPPGGSPLQKVDLESEARVRSDVFFQALQDDAFQFTLSICSQSNPDLWYDTTRIGLINFLLHDSPIHSSSLTPPSPHFRILLMEKFQSFADAFINSMPDILRQFKMEEDTQRIRIRSALRNNPSEDISGQSFHLERFLLIISFSLDQRVDAAETFWDDVESNLYGFLQWASRRQTTPCVGAFCEMLRSIAQGEKYATAAHHFLLEESSSTPARIRKLPSLSWTHIFDELNFYTTKIREQPAILRSANEYDGNVDNAVELESPFMLENYLRLISHLCNESDLVRSWILTQSNFPLLDVLFNLCNSQGAPRLHACCFSVVKALLTEKSADLSQIVWTSLDQWVFGRLASPQPKVLNASAHPDQIIFHTIAESFEETREFSTLLRSLMAPSIQSTQLNDQLPFPENLGSAYRMPGIEPFVDFVLGKVYTSLAARPEDKIQQSIIAWDVLNFAVVCLESFNEDLVILANRSRIPVDEAMNTSSLLAYVRLHPFSRIMEWMFNDRVLNALFATAHQDVDEVAAASADSPLILSLVRSIDVMYLVMELQSTYLDIVRPLIKLQTTGRKQPVLNPTLASFEDSVALNLGLIVDLGLYAGAGNQDLAVTSLRLLSRLASSRKLNVSPTAAQSQRPHGNRLISVIEQNDEMNRIARSLSLSMQFDMRELSNGNDAPGWTIKSVILDFLIQCLSTFTDRPTLAHALLGFSCSAMTVDVEPESAFADGLSLFHAILHLVVEYPNGIDGDMQSWCLTLKQKSMRILSMLWNSPLTSIITMLELREKEFLFALFIRQATIGPRTPWDERSIDDPEFMITESAEAFGQYLWQRRFLLEYASTEVRLVSSEGIPSLQAKIFSTLLGSTSKPDGEQIPNLTIFDLFDFIELNWRPNTNWPNLTCFAGLDFNVDAGTQENSGFKDLKLTDEMITLRLNELRKGGRVKTSDEEQRAIAEAEQIMLFFQSKNNSMKLASARVQTLKAWVDLLTLIIDTCDVERAAKSVLILQALQLATPKLEEFALQNAEEAMDMGSLVLALLFQLDFEASALDRSRAGDVANDRLFSAFRTSLRVISNPQVGMELRDVLYRICYRYLSGMAQTSDAPVHRRHGTQTVKTSGERTINIICDDAYGASPTCRISALLLLDALAALAQAEKSSYIIESLMRTNFIQVVVESIDSIPRELRETPAKGGSPLPTKKIVPSHT